MLKSVSINKVRGIFQGALDDLTPLTMLVGPNSAGKSTVLESIYLGVHPSVGFAASRVAFQHRAEHGATWLVWRRKGDASVTVSNGEQTRKVVLRPTGLQQLECSVEIDGVLAREKPAKAQENSGNLSVPTSVFDELTVPLADIPFSRFVGAFDATNLPRLFSEAVDLGLRDVAIAVAEELLPDIQRIEILLTGTTPTLYGSNEHGTIPLSLVGDGIQSLLSLSLRLVAPRNTVVLLEEPEAHKHPAAIRTAAKVTFEAVRRGVQVVIATHSLDLIDAILAEAKDDAEVNALSLYRLKLADGTLISTRVAGADLAFSRTEIQGDLR